MKKRRHKKKKKRILIILLSLLIVLMLLFLCMLINDKRTNNIVYSEYYSKYIFTNENANLYKFINNQYIYAGEVYDNIYLTLTDDYDEVNGYFKIDGFDNDIYIKYSDFEKSDGDYYINTRYKNYIPFNESIITKKGVTFYNNQNDKLYTLEDSYEFPIIIKDTDKYYVEYNNSLLYIKSDDVDKIVDNNNASVNNTIGIAVLNYHFVYDPNEENCDQEICHTEKQFREHMEYIKNNNFFTPTMYELEKYIDGKLQLPKSVVITIDDGRNVNFATKILEEYQLNATAFIVTSRYDIETEFKKSDFVEFHSHSDALHDVGSCPAGHGQGGGLTCFDDDKILNDLKLSRSKLNNSTVFCYPFYEYTEHSINLLKQAGFTMAFGGEYEGGYINVKPGINKFKIPRWVMVTYTTMDKFASYLSGGE